MWSWMVGEHLESAFAFWVGFFRMLFAPDPLAEYAFRDDRPDGGTDRILSMGRNGDPTTRGLPS